ncbi:MAG: hypothetical protein ACRDHY_05750 [Anaerolineales bacterium]
MARKGRAPPGKSIEAHRHEEAKRRNIPTVRLRAPPRATLEIPSPARRLDRILELIAACRYSFHDLSRVQLSGGAPRFNMPFEVGLAVATARWRPAHQWFLLEARPYRLQQTLSDLGGTDAYTTAMALGGC